MIRRIFFFLIAASLAGLIAWAKPEGDNDYSRIARLSYLEGQVSFQHTSDADWSAASINFPLQPGDRVSTGPDGRAEIEFDDGSVFRLAENSDIELLSLKDDLIQLRIFSGLFTLKVSGAMDYEIDTPAAAFNTLGKGAYRFDVLENGNTDAIVREGELEAANDRFSRRIRMGELLHVESGENGLDSLSRYNRRDQWDDWTDRRDAEANAYSGGKYIPPAVRVGSTELGRYGRWVQVESYGSVWVPLHVDVAWSPYSVGRWCYRPFWGWTWVSYEPWGWLPYHYGRWYHHSRVGWCWIPGPDYAFNFWSPGLVVFYQGSGWISWGPLGPGDYYDINHYYYNRRLHGHYLVQLRALNTRGPNDPFNRHVRGAFRTIDDDHFRNGAFGGRDWSPRWRNVDQPWRSGTLVRNRITIHPTAASYSGNPNRPVFRPQRVNTLPAVVRTAPASRGGNHSKVKIIATSRGYSTTRQDRDRSQENRQENNKPRTIWRADRPGNQPNDNKNSQDNRVVRPQNPSDQRDGRKAQPRENRDNRNSQPQSGSPDQKNDRDQSNQPSERKAQPRTNESSGYNRFVQPQSGGSDQWNVRQNPRTYQVPQTQYSRPRTTYVSPNNESRSTNSGGSRTYSTPRRVNPTGTIIPSSPSSNSRVDTSRFSSSGGNSSGQAIGRSDQGSAGSRSGGGETRNSDNHNSSNSSNSSGGGHARSRR